MRVLQLIDSLRPGGAEKMAVNYANALVKRTDASFLCCTRMEGLLKAELRSEIGYLFLNKKRTLDLKAFLKLRKFINENKIDLIQAHSSSWFLAIWIKTSLRGVKLVWHDHYGRELGRRKPGMLRFFSKYFDAVIAVNSNLERWSKEKLEVKKVQYFQNFFSEPPGAKKNHSETLLLQELCEKDSDFKIICLANLRPQKDHINLLKSFVSIISSNPNVTLHLVGKDEQDEYSQSLKNFVVDNKLKNKVFFHGERGDIQDLLSQGHLGVLSSTSEGLPVALLEYGLAGLPVVCTRVGQCEEVVSGFGKVVRPKDPSAFAGGIQSYLRNSEKRKYDSLAFRRHVIDTYSEEAVMPKVIDLFLNLTKERVTTN